MYNQLLDFLSNPWKRAALLILFLSFPYNSDSSDMNSFELKISDQNRTFMENPLMLSRLVSGAASTGAAGDSSYDPYCTLLVPPKEYEPKIYVGREAFSKEPFYYKKGMTALTHIVCEELDSQPGPDIGIFDQFSLHIADFSGNDKSVIVFDWKGGILEPDIRRKGKGFQIIVRGHNPLGIMDQKGRPVWIYDHDHSYSMAPGDLNQDGRTEYYVTSFTFSQLNENGQKIWETEKQGFHDVDVFRSPEKNRQLAVTAKHDRKVQFWDYNGNIVREWTAGQDIYFFRICDWFGSYQILSAYDREIFMTDMNGKTVFRHSLSFCPTAIYGIRGVPVTFHKKEYLAILAQFSSATGLSMLCMFSPEKKLVYQELLKVTSAMAAVRCLSASGEILLVGDGPGKVSKYLINNSAKPAD